MKLRGIRSIAQLTRQQHGTGFIDYNLRHQLNVSLDPFLNLDDFHMSLPTFRAHPHAGFSAVTYLFEDSTGAFLNRDSLGDRSRIDPGDLHWTQAASGMLHEEVPETPGADCHGLQMFVTLSEDNELKLPRSFHLNSADVPEVKTDGVRIRVLCGESNGVVSPLNELLTPITLLDIHLKPNAAVTHELPEDYFALAMVIHGEACVDTLEGLTTIAQHQAIAFAQDGDAVKFTSGSTEAHILFGAGEPTGRSNVWAGPFCLSSQQRASEAIERYQQGRMGFLSSSF
jgi:redox-sensitive bicupin YhaK (pirin superfamily)